MNFEPVKKVKEKENDLTTAVIVLNFVCPVENSVTAGGWDFIASFCQEGVQRHRFALDTLVFFACTETINICLIADIKVIVTFDLATMLL